MEKTLQHRVNHLSFGDVVKIIVNPFHSIADSKESRENMARKQLVAMINFIQVAYDFPTMDPVKFSNGDGTITMPRKDGVEHLPDGMKDTKNMTPTYGAYIWARQQAYYLAGLSKEEVEKRTGYPSEKVDISGKIDWNTVLKQAGVFVGSVLAGFIAAGPAGAAAGAISGMAATKQIQKAADAAKTSAIVKGVAPILAQQVSEIAAKQEAERILLEAENNPMNKLASFMSFKNPYFIMIAMAIAVIILTLVAKKFNK